MMKSIVSILYIFVAALLLSSPVQAGYADGMNQYAAYHVMHGGLDPSGEILVAIDGTGSRTYLDGREAGWIDAPEAGFDQHIPAVPEAPKTRAQRWRSHVRNFHFDYNDGPKKYLHGPDTSFPTTIAGSQSSSIHSESYEWLCAEWRKNNCKGPIDLVGFSRGGYIAMNIAYDLKNIGCKVEGKTHKDIEVRFLGMYDPVDSALGYGNTGAIPSNVKHSYVARAVGQVSIFEPLIVKSRWYFNREGHSADSESTNLTVHKYKATHGALGGAPWDGDRPTGHTEANDISAARTVDRNMRREARNAGVNIPMINKYGYATGEGKKE